jgi:hypothetical protein
MRSNAISLIGFWTLNARGGVLGSLAMIAISIGGHLSLTRGGLLNEGRCVLAAIEILTRSIVDLSMRHKERS